MAPYPPLDPAHCTHRRFRRLGIMRSLDPRRRLYLLHCMYCSNTLSTLSLRSRPAGRSFRPFASPILEP